MPSMFQGLLNIEGILVQHRVSGDSHVTFGGHFGSHIKNMKNAYKQLFHAKIDKTSIYIKYQTLVFIQIYCFIRYKSKYSS